MKSLSVIIPCYNCEQSIHSLLAEIEVQINGKDIEVILINDGSTDATSAVLADFLKGVNSSNWKLFNFQNQGAAAARMNGLKLATGLYVAFIDSDDIIGKNYMDKIYSTIRQDSPDVIYFSCVQHLGKDEPLKTKISFQKEETLENATHFFQAQLHKGAWTAAVWTYVFRRDMAEQFDAIFTHRKAHEDHLFTLRIILNAKKIIIIPDILYIQNVTIGSLTNSLKSITYLEDRYRAYYEGVKYITEMNVGKQIISMYRSWSLNQCAIICIELFKTKELLISRAFLRFGIKHPDLLFFVLKKRIYDFLIK